MTDDQIERLVKLTLGRAIEPDVATAHTTVAASEDTIAALRATVGWQEKMIKALLEYLAFSVQLEDEDRTHE